MRPSLEPSKGTLLSALTTPLSTLFIPPIAPRRKAVRAACKPFKVRPLLPARPLQLATHQVEPHAGIGIRQETECVTCSGDGARSQLVLVK